MSLLFQVRAPGAGRATACEDLYAVAVFGFSGSEFLLIVVVVMVVVGPKRLPEYTRTLTRLVKRLRVFVESSKEQIAQEVGPELAELDLSELDPRQYDPRKIVREALGEDIEAIKKDLSEPFKSVKKAADEATGAALEDVNAAAEQDRAKGSLAQRIEAKKEEAKADKQPSAVQAVGAATAALVAKREPEEVQKQVAAQQGAQDQSGQVPDSGDDSAQAPGSTVAPEKAPEPSDELDEAEPQEPEAVKSEADGNGAAAAAAVPSTLKETVEPPKTAQPLSPRDIVRAARAAALSQV